MNKLKHIGKRILFICVLMLAGVACFFCGASYQKIKTMNTDSYTVTSIEFWEAFFDEESLSRDMQERLYKLNALYD